MRMEILTSDEFQRGKVAQKSWVLKRKFYAATLFLVALVGGVLSGANLMVGADLLGQWLVVLLPIVGIVGLVVRLSRIRRGLIESWDNLLEDEPAREKGKSNVGTKP